LAGIKTKALDLVLSKRGGADLGKDAGDCQVGGQVLANSINLPYLVTIGKQKGVQQLSCNPLFLLAER